jgi:hypothetical protein
MDPPPNIIIPPPRHLRDENVATMRPPAAVPPMIRYPSIRISRPSSRLTVPQASTTLQTDQELPELHLSLLEPQQLQSADLPTPGRSRAGTGATQLPSLAEHAREEKPEPTPAVQVVPLAANPGFLRRTGTAARSVLRFTPRPAVEGSLASENVAGREYEPEFVYLLDVVGTAFSSGV